MSADTIVPGYGNPQTLNRYAYTLNNPLRYTDPTGHMVACEDGDICVHDYPTPPATGGSGNDPHDPTEEEDDPNPNGSSTVDETSPIEIIARFINDLLSTAFGADGMPIVLPLDPFGSSDSQVLPAIWTPRNPSDWEALARRLGMNRKELTGNVESCKENAGVPPDGNVQVDDETGDIYYRGEHIGNAYDGC